MTGPTYGWFELDGLSGPRLTLALEFFDQGRPVIFEGIAFAFRNDSIECAALSSWAEPDQQSALVDLDRAALVLEDLVAKSPEFASRAQGRPWVFQLVADACTGTVVIAERRDGILRWSAGFPANLVF